MQIDDLDDINLDSFNLGVGILSMDQIFEWNILSYISISQVLEWNVGEGPLFWYRLEWTKGSTGEPATHLYTDVYNIRVGKGDVLPSDTILGYDKAGKPVRLAGLTDACNPRVDWVDITTRKLQIAYGPGLGCGHEPNQCTCETFEVWHMMATSVAHLCQRILAECFPTTKKLIKKVQKFDRPALCCDVDRYNEEGKIIDDKWEDVDYSELCDCGCALVSGVLPPEDISSSKLGLFGIHGPQPDVSPGFEMSELKVVKRRERDVVTPCGHIPDSLVLTHNLQRANVLGAFLARHKLTLPTRFELFYSQSADCWQKTFHFDGSGEHWTVLYEWSYSDDHDPGNYGWKFHVHVSRQVNGRRQNTRLAVTFASHGMLDRDQLFGVAFNVNTKTQGVITRQPVAVRHHVMTDEIGLFRGDWAKEPFLTATVSLR